MDNGDAESVVISGADITDDLYGSNGVGYVTVSSNWIVDDVWEKYGDPDDPIAPVTFTVGSYWSSVADPVPTATVNITLSTIASMTASGKVQGTLSGDYGDFESAYVRTADTTDVTATGVLTYGTTINLNDHFDVNYQNMTLPSFNPKNLYETSIEAYSDSDWIGGEASTTATMVCHKPDDNSGFPSDSENWVYFDVIPEWYVSEAEHPYVRIQSPIEILQEGCAQGEVAMGIFVRADYTADTTIDGTALTNYLTTYGVVNQDSGTPNTVGYKPTTGYHTSEDFDECYVAFHVDGTKPVAQTEYADIVVGPVVNAIPAGVGYKRTDFDTTASSYRHMTFALLPNGS